jgi:hypothetical protein
MNIEESNITRLAEGFESLTEHDIIERNKDLLLDCLQVKDLSQVTVSDLYDFSFSREDETIPSKKRLAVYCVWLMLKIIETRRNLEDPAQDFITNIYQLASRREQYIAASYDLEWFENERDAWSKIKSSLGRGMGWKKEQEKCLPAVEEAIALWKNNDLRNLPEMLTHLLNKKEYKELPHKTLRAMLYPVAQKYKKLYDPKAPRTKNERKHI